jgi:hypothetical protein
MKEHELYLYDVMLGIIEDGKKHSKHRMITVAAIDAEHVTIELRDRGLLDYDEENDIEEFIQSIRVVGKLDYVFDGS